MISFRYHVVSIVAVFLALALGIIVGTTALNGPITDGLRKQVDSLSSDRSTLAAQVTKLKSQSSDADSFAQSYGSKVVAAQLTGKRVLLVGLPGSASGVKDALVKSITAAGGTVAGRLQMNADYFNPARANDIKSLVTSGTGPTGLQLPTTDDAGTLGGTLLAYVLAGEGQDTDISQTLAGFSTLQLLSVEGSDNVKAADVVVLVTSGAPTDPAAGKNQLTLAASFQNQKLPSVVAGDAASDAGQGLVALIRADNSAAKTISTIDNVDTSLGQVSTVLALATKSPPNAYGTAAGADSPFPAPTG